MANRPNARAASDSQRAAPDPENSVEFCVKPAEDLVLEGTHKSLLRVRANTPYSCIMLKSQRFASLFRHYAKHHGLDKDTLVFFFTEELQNDDTPESVHMQRNDEIVVRTRKAPKSNIPICADSTYFSHFRSLLFDREDADMVFVVGLAKDQVPAHKVILTARSDYFRALFRKGGMKESEEGVMVVESYTLPTLRRMLEFIYTNRVESLSACTPTEVIDLLGLADEYLLTDLKCLCEKVGASMIDIDGVGRLLCAADRHGCEGLKEHCIDFVLEHSDQVMGKEEDKSLTPFLKEVERVPNLLATVLRAVTAVHTKKRKRSDPKTV